MLSTPELVERFTLDRVSRNPARFDETKLKWLNGIYIRSLPAPELATRLERFYDREGLGRAAAISREKIHTLADFWPLAGPLLGQPVDDPKARGRWLDEGGLRLLSKAGRALAEVDPFEEAGIQRALGALMSARAPSRATSPPAAAPRSPHDDSPGMFESLALLGATPRWSGSTLPSRPRGRLRRLSCRRPRLSCLSQQRPHRRVRGHAGNRVAVRISCGPKVRFAALPIGIEKAD